MSVRLEGGAPRACGAADAPSGDATSDSHLQPNDSVLLKVAPAVPELVAPEVDMLVVSGLLRDTAAARRRRARLKVRHVVRAFDDFFIAVDDLETDHISAIKAFTQADADCKLFAEMPQGFAVAGLVLEINKALEGIPQGAHLWFNLNRRVMLEIGFESFLSEPNLYRLTGQRIIVGVFADDILAGFHRSAIKVYKKIKLEYSKAIRIGDIAIKPADVFIGVQLRRDRHFETTTLTVSSRTSRRLSSATRRRRASAPRPMAGARRRSSSTRWSRRRRRAASTGSCTSSCAARSCGPRAWRAPTSSMR